MGTLKKVIKINLTIKNLTLFSNNERKERLKKYEELWSKPKDHIKSKIDDDDDDEKYLKIKFSIGDDLPLNKTLKLNNMIIVVRTVSHEGKKYYPQAFLDERLCKLKMLNCDRTDVSEGIDANKTNGLHECIICHYWYFLEIKRKFQPELCNGSHDLKQKL